MANLQDFIVENRDQIIELVRQRSRERTDSPLAEASDEYGIPRFLSQLTDALALNRADAASPSESHRVGMADTATLHGHALLKNGFTIGQVVHGYGDVCQVVTELATNAKTAISPDDFRVFNRCLDDAIAGAVTAYGDQREVEINYEGTERMGVLAHEMRNLLNAAILSFEVIQRGEVGPSGSMGAIHRRSLADLRSLIERSLTEVRLDAGVPQIQRILLTDVIEEARASAVMQADARGVTFNVGPIIADVAVEADRQLLGSALMNLLQNAFKYSKPPGSVTLATLATPDRVAIEVADACGGLPVGRAEELFRPFARRSSDHSGLGLGLSIARNAVRANGGELSVRDVPGTGCVFTIDLPRVN